MSRFSLLTVIVLLAGCSLPARPPAPQPSFADADPTFRLPQQARGRDKGEKGATPSAAENPYRWWGWSSLIDDRTKKIESDLGY